MIQRPHHMLRPKFDANELAAMANPYPLYAELREAGPVCRGGPGEWIVTRYNEVAALLDDERLENQFPPEYYSLAVGHGPAQEFLTRILLHRDGPKHRLLRRVLVRHFGPKAMVSVRPKIVAVVQSLLSKAVASSRLEVVQDIALLLPSTVMFSILGFPSDERDEVRRNVLNLGKAFSSVVGHDDRKVADQAVLWLREYTVKVIEQRRLTPRDDLLTELLVNFEDASAAARDELVDNVIFLLFAGFETTSSVISTGCAALLNHPPQLELLRGNLALLPSAIEEFLRYDAPIQSRLKLVNRPIDIDGMTLKPGRVLLLLIGSANHDAAKFLRPEILDVTRAPNPHVSFGGGSHYCLGATLARLESTLFFGELLRRFTQFEPDGQFVQLAGGSFRSYERIPISLRPLDGH